MSLVLTPVTLRQANAFIERHHRHHPGKRGHRFAVGVARDGQLVGVAIAANPVSKALADGFTIEVSRTCTDGARNANSCLYAALWRAARSLGYTRLFTYTDLSESGSSLRAVGFRMDGVTEGRAWSRPKRKREARYPISPKVRWVLESIRKDSTIPLLQEAS